VELDGRFELERGGGSPGDLRGRFVLRPGQLLPWRAATLVEVKEEGKPDAWQFIGPVVLW
jgi:hypothetical protein